MNTHKPIFLSAFMISTGCFLSLLMLPLFRAAAADSTVPVPAIVEKGFALWAEKDVASWAMDAWKIGGLLESDAKPAALSKYFARLDQTLGNYKSHAGLSAKSIGENSRILYVTVQFEHAIIYGRFLLYHTDKDWVVQNMDFSTKPEAVMPWLAFTGETYTQ